MTTIYAEVEINAPKELVWDALIVKENWMYWNTFLYDCKPSQHFQPGQKVSLSLRRLTEDEETEFEGLVTLLQSEVCLQLVSSLPGLRNEHIFELQEIGFRRTKYIHKERFSGILSRVFVPFIREDEQKGIQRMARELKRYVETQLC